MEGVFDFGSGMTNITGFLTLIQQNGLNVLLRPGPYIDAEWEYGGFPYWLLKYDGIKMRTSDANFTRAVQNYYTQLLPLIKPFLYKNGGPILMIQVENEYGFMISCDRDYMAWLRDLIWSQLGNETVLYTTDVARDSRLVCGAVPGTVTTVDFAPTTNHSLIDQYFEVQDNYSKGAPHVSSEFYTDWFLQWGAKEQSLNAAENASMLVDNIDYIRTTKNGNMNLYLVHGGTNFAFYNGAKVTDGSIISSYWVNAPIAENGDVNYLYTAIQSYISTIPNYDNPPQPTPANNPRSSYGQVIMNRIGQNLISTLTQIQQTCTSSLNPTDFEWLDYPYGYVLYTTTLAKGGNILSTPNIADFGYVFFNNVYKGMLFQEKNITTLSIQAKAGDILRVLVENRGRLDHDHDKSYYTAWEYKGIRSNATLDGTSVQDWYQCPINMTMASINSLSQNFYNRNHEISSSTSEKAISQPGVFTGQFNATVIQDTYLNTTGWGKGQFFLNGYNIGRYWPTAGPQIALYIPKFFLQPTNTIVLIELNGASQNSVNLVDQPIFVFGGV